MTNALSLSFSLSLSLSLCPSLNGLPDVCRSTLCTQRCGVVTPTIRWNLRFVPDLVSHYKPQTREPGRDYMNLSHNVPTARQMSSQISLSRVRCSYPSGLGSVTLGQHKHASKQKGPTDWDKLRLLPCRNSRAAVDLNRQRLHCV